MKNQFSEPPIIIGGCGRSGTTLLYSIISANPHIYSIPQETTFFCPNSYSKENYGINSTISDFSIFYNKFLKNADSRFNRWTEKTPNNIFFFKKIIEYFNGKIKLIQIIRDGRDVILSRHSIHRSRHWIPIERWIDSIETGKQFFKNHHAYTLKYEDLILSFDKTIDSLAAFLSIDSSYMLNWFQNASHRKDQAFHGGTVKEIYTDSIGKYKNLDREKNQELRDQDELALKNFLSNKHAMRLLDELGYKI